MSDSPRPAKRARVDDQMADVDDWDDVYVVVEGGGEEGLPAATSSSDLPLTAATSSSDVPPAAATYSSDLPLPAATSSSDVPLPPVSSSDVPPAATSDTAAAPPSPHPLHPNPAASPTPVAQEGSPVENISTNDELITPENVADNPSAEWRFDSSDAASSSDSSDSDSSDDDSDEEGSEDDYELLDPAQLAKILMDDGGDEDEGGAKNRGGKGAADAQPRTANEVKEVEIIKPDVEITPSTKISFLGTVERLVENMALIKGATPGEYRVLESGSVLCDQARRVLGAVADTFGRVQEPLYSIAFTNAEAIADAGLEHGSKVYYVDEHSTFVFTQPLRNLKGTDASNIHDEEVAEHEAEFSDDEAEAEAKRMKKQAKQAARGGGAGTRGRGRGGARTFGAAPGHDSGTHGLGESDAPTQNYGGGMTYDDDDRPPAVAEFYSPLKRPENLSELMAGGVAPNRPMRGGRGGGGRGGVDRGRGGRGARGTRGDRGGRGRGNENNSSSSRGNAHSFPDRHNATAPLAATVQHGLPSKPSAPQGALMENPQPQGTYQFGGYQFQFNPQPQQQQSAPVTGGGHVPQQQPYATTTPAGYTGQQEQQTQIPGGAHVNPAFFGHQQQQQFYPFQQQQQQQQQLQQGWGGQQQWNEYSGWQGQQQGGQQQAAPPPPPNLSDILKTLGAGVPPPPPQK